MPDEGSGYVTAFTVFLELPWDLRLDLVHTWTYESGPPWPGWDLASMALLIGVPEPLQEGTRPNYRLAFRRTRVKARGANDGVEAAFLSEMHPDLTPSRRLRRRARLVARRVRPPSES